MLRPIILTLLLLFSTPILSTPLRTPENSEFSNRHALKFPTDEPSRNWLPTHEPIEGYNHFPVPCPDPAPSILETSPSLVLEAKPVLPVTTITVTSADDILALDPAIIDHFNRDPSIVEKFLGLSFPFSFTLPSFLRFAQPAPCENRTLYITADDPDPECRRREIKRHRAGWQYGPSVLGETSYYPNGTLGKAQSKKEQALWWAEEVDFGKLIFGETAEAGAAVAWEDGLQDLDDYKAIYDDQWQSTVPGGVSPGALQNFRSDRFFAMQRLTGNAFSLHRVSKDYDLPFSVDDEDVAKIVDRNGATLESLQDEGRLFIVDHRFFKEEIYRENLIEGRYAGASVALFYLDGDDELMPLAIATGAKDDDKDEDDGLLVYTKLDGKWEWLLAKIVFNSNDLWWGQIYHLIATHSIAEIAYLAAIRTIAERHPVRAYLDRVMYRAWAIRPIGAQVLFNEGGIFDFIFSISSKAVLHFAHERYHSRYGSFSGGYFATELAHRGVLPTDSDSEGSLYIRKTVKNYFRKASNITTTTTTQTSSDGLNINTTSTPSPYDSYPSTFSPPNIKTFPFYTDMSRIHSSLHSFTHSYLSAFYPNASSVSSDPELKAWFREANGAAKVHDFPSSSKLSLETLTDVLTHMAYLAGPKHASLNMGTIFTTSGVLPFDPAALYHDLPTTKGVVDREEELIKYLPNKVQSVSQAHVLALFNRPEDHLERFGWRMVDVWKDLGDRVEGGEGDERGKKGKVKEAVGKWENEMWDLADEVEQRGQLPEGKEGGMEYRQLSPRRFPFFLAI